MGVSLCHFFLLTTIESGSWAKLFMGYSELQRSKNCTVPTKLLRTHPSFCVLFYGATCLIATQITFGRLEIDFFSFSSEQEKRRWERQSSHFLITSKNVSLYLMMMYEEDVWYSSYILFFILLKKNWLSPVKNWIFVNAAKISFLDKLLSAFPTFW